MAKKKKTEWFGYQDAEDYFKNAPDELLQKHYSRIEDFETSMVFDRALRQFRNPWPLLEPNYKILEHLKIERF